MLGQRLRSARKEKKLTQEKLAKMLNTKKTTISNYETEYSSPSNEMLNDLADVLEVSTDYLLGRTDDKKGIVIQNNIIKTNTEPSPEELIDDHNLGIWFKEGKKSSAANRQKALDFLRYLEEQEIGRKPGDKQ